MTCLLMQQDKMQKDKTVFCEARKEKTLYAFVPRAQDSGATAGSHGYEVWRSRALSKGVAFHRSGLSHAATPTRRRGAPPVAFGVQARQLCARSSASQGAGSAVAPARSGVAPAPRDSWPERKQPTRTVNYGGADFSAILQDNQFYVDRTAYLAKLDGIKRAVLMRPPRWGKSLWLSMMECYHGAAHKERFGELFGGLDIVRRAKELQPDTSLQSSFHVLRVVLPGLITSSDPKDYVREFDQAVLPACEDLLYHLHMQQDA